MILEREAEDKISLDLNLRAESSCGKTRTSATSGTARQHRITKQKKREIFLRTFPLSPLRLSPSEKKSKKTKKHSRGAKATSKKAITFSRWLDSMGVAPVPTHGNLVNRDWL